ncbi:MAG: ankyrin repeat domain-containing protein [Armatimonadota bacterium]
MTKRILLLLAFLAASLATVGALLNAAAPRQLLSAAERGDRRYVAALLDRGVSPSVRGRFGGTPLTLAAEHGHLAVVEELLERGASVDEAAEDGTTALHFAAQGGHTEIVGLLLKRGADPNRESRGYWTPLLTAAAGGHTGTVELLLGAGADPDAATADWETGADLAESFGYKQLSARLRRAQREQERRRAAVDRAAAGKK